MVYKSIFIYGLKLTVIIRQMGGNGDNVGTTMHEFGSTLQKLFRIGLIYIRVICA